MNAPLELLVPRLADLPDTIITPNLIIDPLHPDDIDAYESALRETWEDMHKWVGWAESPIEKTIEKFREKTLGRFEEFQKRESFFMAARDPKIREILSFVTLYNVQDDARAMEAGGWTRKKYMNKVISREASIALLKWGFEQIGAHKIWAETSEDHRTSIAIMKAMGFEFDYREPEPTIMPDGRSVHKVNYKITDPSRLPPLEVRYERRL